MTSPAPSPDDLTLLRTRTFDELAVGDAASVERVLTREDVHAFAALAGVAVERQQATPQASVARGTWGGALIGTLIDCCPRRHPGVGPSWRRTTSPTERRRSRTTRCWTPWRPCSRTRPPTGR